jgi:hypothetical protein
MPKKHKSRPSSSVSSIEISSLARAYGITRDQARRLINRIANNRAKLSEAARILKARLPSRSVSEAKHPRKPPRSSISIVCIENAIRIDLVSCYSSVLTWSPRSSSQRADLKQRMPRSDIS